MPKTDKELADELDARDRLRNRGYEQVKCGMCNGFGWQGHPEVNCPACEGRGYRWQAPITK